MKLKIENTESGEVVSIRLQPSVDLFKFEVSLMFPIPPHDQIILYGPPYRIIDSVYADILKQYGGPSIGSNIINNSNTSSTNSPSHTASDKSADNSYDHSNIVLASPITRISSPTMEPLSSSSISSPPLSSSICNHAKRCFLYNRKLLSSSDKEPKLIRLLPLKPNSMILYDVYETTFRSSGDDGGNINGNSSREIITSDNIAQHYEQYYKNILQAGVAYEIFIADRYIIYHYHHRLSSSTNHQQHHHYYHHYHPYHHNHHHFHPIVINNHFTNSILNIIITIIFHYLIYHSIKACESSLEQQRIHYDGLEAAILNLQFFYHAIDKSYNNIGTDDAVNGSDGDRHGDA